MKSIYFRNFMATAILVLVSFLAVALSFVGIGRTYVISAYRQEMETSAKEVSRAASAISQGENLSSWVLSMSISSIAQSTGNHIFITDPQGVVVSCSDRSPICEHMGLQIPQELLEEIGLRTDFTDLPPALTLRPGQVIDDFYILRGDPAPETLRLQAEEVQAVRWADAGDIHRMIDAGTFIPYKHELIDLLFALRDSRGCWTRPDRRGIAG